MDAERLAFVCEFLFPGGKWKLGLARYLGVDRGTVDRWIRADRVPRAVEIAMEQSFQWGLYKKAVVANE